jgi:hypothetical protein
MHRLLTPGLFLTGFHIGHVAGEPVVELDAQFGFERFGIDAGADAAEDVEPVRVRAFQASRGAIEKRFGSDRDPDVGHAPAVEFGSIEAGRSDADDGEQMAIDLVTGAHDGRIGAAFITPDVMAHDGEGGAPSRSSASVMRRPIQG